MKRPKWFEERKSIGWSDSLAILTEAKDPKMLQAIKAVRARLDCLRWTGRATVLFHAQCRIHAVGLFMRSKGVPMTAKNIVFEMCRFAIAGHDGDLRDSCGGKTLTDALLDFTLYWLPKLQEAGKMLPDDDSRFSIDSEVDIRAQIRSCLRRIRLRAGIHPVAEAKRRASISRREFIDSSIADGADSLVVLVAATAMELPKLSEGSTFVFPVTDEVAQIFNTSRSTIGRAVEEVVDHGLLKVVTRPNHKAGRARRFQLDMDFRRFSDRL